MNIAESQLKRLIEIPASWVDKQRWWTQFLEEWTKDLKSQLDRMTLSTLGETHIGSIRADKWKLGELNPQFVGNQTFNLTTRGFFCWYGDNGICVYGLTRGGVWITSAIDFSRDTQSHPHRFEIEQTTLKKLLVMIPGEDVWQGIFLNPIRRWEADRREKAEIAAHFRKNAEFADELMRLATT